MGSDKLKLSTDEIIEKYADMVYRLAVNEAGSKEDASDVFQEVFLRLVKYQDRITSEEHLKAWLIRVTINCAKKNQGSFWKKNVGFYEEEDGKELLYEKSQLDYERVEDTDSPVSSAIRALPEIYRNVIYLFYYEELDIRQISEILGEKEATVKSRLHRARESLRGQLKGEDVL